MCAERYGVQIFLTSLGKTQSTSDRMEKKKMKNGDQPPLPSPPPPPFSHPTTYPQNSHHPTPPNLPNPRIFPTPPKTPHPRPNARSQTSNPRVLKRTYWDLSSGNANVRCGRVRERWNGERRDKAGGGVDEMLILN